MISNGHCTRSSTVRRSLSPFVRLCALLLDVRPAEQKSSPPDTYSGRCKSTSTTSRVPDGRASALLQDETSLGAWPANHSRGASPPGISGAPPSDSQVDPSPPRFCTAVSGLRQNTPYILKPPACPRHPIVNITDITAPSFSCGCLCIGQGVDALSLPLPFSNSILLELASTVIRFSFTKPLALDRAPSPM